jgi:hypothetical protein
LAAEAFARQVVFAPRAHKLIEREYPGLTGFVIGLLLNNMAASPRAALDDPAILRLIGQGVLRAPSLNVTKLKQLADLPAYKYKGTWGDEQMEVHLLTPAQAAACTKHPCFSSG